MPSADSSRRSCWRRAKRSAVREDVRAVIVTGAGERAFCAGADLKERRMLAPDERAAHTAAIEAAAEALAALPMPTIAAVRGFALAGGAELAIACDLRVAAEDATFGFPEVKIGIFPGAGGALRLPRLVGSGAARDLLFTGRQIAAEEAFRMGWSTGSCRQIRPGGCHRTGGHDRGKRAAGGAGGQAGAGGESRYAARRGASRRQRATGRARRNGRLRRRSGGVRREALTALHRPLTLCAAATSARTRPGSTGFPAIPSTFAAVPTIAPSAISSSEGSVIAVAPLPT